MLKKIKGKIRGINTALITPFDPEGNVDENGLRILLRDQVDKGIKGVAVVAGSGEYVNLSKKECARVVEISVEEIAGRINVIAGVLETNTRDAVNWSKEAADLGADGLLVLTPYYNKPSKEGIYNHFRSIAEASELPIIIYNNPGRTGIQLMPEDYLKLAEIPYIEGVKECNRDMATLSDTISLLESKWSILCGDDDILYPALALGAHGGILTTATVIPSLWVNMYNAILNNDYDKAKSLHYQTLVFFKAIMAPNHPSLVKKAASLIGLPAGHTRAPLADPTEEQEKHLKNVIESMKLKINISKFFDIRSNLNVKR